MKVFIADFDLFERIGGGQSVYRGLVLTNRNIDFYYLTTGEQGDGPRPRNAHGIPFKELYRLGDFQAFHDIHPPRWIYPSFVKASNLAAAVAGREFDVVESADYEQCGTLLGPALRHHGVRYGRLALSMHGRISTTVRLNWGTEGKTDRALELVEEMQFRTVDTRYGISRFYLDEWRAIVDFEAHYLNPLRFLPPPNPTMTAPSAEPPSLNFVGRTEKRKGPDIFIDLAWWLPRSSFSTANIIGPPSTDAHGVYSNAYLYSMANNRMPDIRILPALGPAGLRELFASRAMTMLPSRYDTLNLLALESLFAGCPTAVGTGAGVCRFLDEQFAGVPYVKIDVRNVLAAVPEIVAVLENYDDHRERLVDALRRTHPEVSGPTLREIYESPPVHDPAARAELDQWYTQLARFYDASRRSSRRRSKAAVKAVLRSTLPLPVRRGVRTLQTTLHPRRLLDNAKSAVVERVQAEPEIARQALKIRHLAKRYLDVFYMPEQSERDLRDKIRKCWRLAAEFRVDRARMWREIGRLERLRGNDLMAATYQLRVMRLFGEDRFADLAAIVRALEANGFGVEAGVAEAMYGGEPETRAARCAAILDEARERSKTAPHWEFELLDDRRGSHEYRVSIIVSLYNAAPKLRLFLQALHNQTLIKAGRAEIILIDSGSPGEEYQAFRALMRGAEVPIVYARSAQRETIQSAWNRGIALSRAPYLTFLGTDETILPDCLETLAAELDADPTLDWVEGNSWVTNVDENGVWVSDIMPYDRTGYRQELVYLETCYLSWVGALYRRSIHERFGLYDASFGAAGDTEFKNRVLPFIKTKAIPRTLGVFWNYPEERTTLSPRAEIEDLRAWYLHRTPAGIAYAFGNRDPAEVDALLRDALRYRKSYCRHWSTDVEYASHLADFLRSRAPGAPVLRTCPEVPEVLAAYRSLEWLPWLTPWRAVTSVLRVARTVEAIQEREAAASSGAVHPCYGIFNDNRHEQHSHVWRSDTDSPDGY